MTFATMISKEINSFYRSVSYVVFRAGRLGDRRVHSIFRFRLDLHSIINQSINLFQVFFDKHHKRAKILESSTLNSKITYRIQQAWVRLV